MAVDRGGLQYSIEVLDKFSANTELFRSEIRAARVEFAELKAEMASQGTEARQIETSSQRIGKAISVEAAAQKKLAAEIRAVKVERATASLAEAEGVARGKEITAQLRLEAQAQAGLNKFLREGASARAQQTKLETADNKARAQRRILEGQLLAQQQQEQAAAASRIAAIRQEEHAKATNLQVTSEQLAAQRQFIDSSGKLNTGLGKQAKLTNDVTNAGKAGNGVFQNLLFTFRRLIGVFAAFLIARQVVGAFTSLISESIRFNAALEQAQLGIASVIAATGQISDAMGGAASSAQQFAIAQKEAGKQVQKLRADALATNATFEQLLETFQVAIGPGLSAGIDLDEIRKLTVKISQAATAIGLPQNQLAEEIRSILSGTIQLRTTRLAAVLGITNQDIKNAKELGTLTQFLTDKFKAFGTAGEQSLTTFNVILTNLKDALSQAFAAGGEGLFGSLKVLFSEIQSSVAVVNKDLGQVTINPQAVQVVEALLSGLQAAVEQGRILLHNLDFKDALNIAQGIGDAFAGFAFLLRNAIEILVSGLGRAFGLITLVVRAAQAIGKAFNFLTGGGSFVGGLLKGALSLLVTFVALRLVLLGIVKLTTFVFITSLGQGTQAAISLLASVRSLRDAFAAIQLIFQSNPIGLALTGLSLVVGFLLTQFGVLDKLFGGADDEAASAADSTEKLSKHFATLSGQIRGASDSGGKFGEVLKELQTDLRETLLSSKIDISAIGLTGGVQQQAKIAGDALIETQKKIFELTNDQASAASTLLGVQRQRALFEKDIQQSTQFTKELIDQSSEAAQNQLAIAERQTQVESDLATARLTLETEREKGAGVEFKDALTRVVGLEKEAQALNLAADKAGKLSDATGEFLALQVKQGTITKEQAADIGALADKRIDFAGQEVSLASQIAEIQAKRKEIEDTILAAAIERVRVVAREEAFRLTLENNGLQQQATALKNIAAARQGLFDTDSIQLQLAATGNELQALKDANTELVFRNALDRARLENIVASTAGTAAEVDAQRQLVLLIQNQSLGQDVANEKIKEAQRQLDLLRFKFAEPVQAGFTAAIEDFRTRAFDDFQNTLELMKTAIEGTTKFLSDALVDAFDPTKKVDIKARFAALLQDIARLIAEQQFAKLIADLLPSTATLEANAAQVTSASTAAGIIVGGGVAAGAALVSSATAAAAILSGQQATTATTSGFGSFFASLFGAHEGGTVPKFASASMAHFGAMVQHFRGGGSVLGRAMTAPPPGIHPSDRVPAWLAEGEHVQPVSSVRKYGSDLFEAFRRGAVPVNLARALLSSSGVSLIRAGGSAGGGYAGGGLVAARRQASLRPSEVAGPSVALVAPTERALQRQLAGGRAAQLRFFGENRDAIRAAQGRRGR